VAANRLIILLCAIIIIPVIIELIGGIMNVDTSGKFIARIIYKMLWMIDGAIIFYLTNTVELWR
jgi:hypothetical protein